MFFVHVVSDWEFLPQGSYRMLEDSPKKVYLQKVDTGVEYEVDLKKLAEACAEGVVVFE